MNAPTKPKAIPIYQEGQDFYVPHFQVILKGKSLPRDVIRDIIQVTYKDDIKEIDSFEITINNWDADKRAFKYSDDQLFDPGKSIELWMGYYGQDKQRLMLTGEITSLRPAFPASGAPTLAISGLNMLHHFRKKQASDTYLKKTDSEVAEAVGRRLGVNVKTVKNPPDPEVRHDYLFQDNQFDIIFLMERARKIGYDLYVMEEDDNGKSGEPTLYFGPSQNVRKATYELTYGKSLIQFQPNLTTANQVGKVTVRSWNRKTKSPIEATVTRDQLQTKSLKNKDEANVKSSFADREEVITDKPVHSKDEAKQLAKKTLENIVKDMVTGSGSTVGLPDLRAGNAILIGGLGERFSGWYFVTSTTHAISDSGYTTQFECRREEPKP